MPTRPGAGETGAATPDVEAGELEAELFTSRHHIDMLLQVIGREVSRTNLLRDTTGFIGLDVCLAELVENKSLASIDVTHDTNDRATKFLRFLILLRVKALLLLRSEQGQLACTASLGIVTRLRIVEGGCAGGRGLLLLSFLRLRARASRVLLAWLFFLLLLLIRRELFTLRHCNGKVLLFGLSRDCVCNIVNGILPVVEVRV